MMRIDAHQHYWEPQRGDYGWLTKERGILYRDYLPRQLEPLLKQYQFRYSVAVQAAPTVDETLYLLKLSESHRSIAGVVGWLDFESARFEEELAGLRLHPRFVGLRPMIQDLPADWLLRRDVRTSMRHLEQERFPIDLQLRPFLLDSAIKLMEHVPQLTAVIDHIAKPVYGEKFGDWEWAMARLAEYPNMSCKLSGMVPERAAPWSILDWKPYVEAALELFGPQRVLFGSDWPVCLLSATYGQVYDSLAALLPSGWEETAGDGLWGANAAAFYRLPV
ncbi:amidohydrolase family protein [Paenibacillus ginsengarvi]|uniref:Amidohydrolase n=1 Tax=Paenibacillus ginsengarvi TaxID=400777 RepID=A0A3B0CS25_9BACL|nr:amidohydrolase family protein [Paenibacillus ginsengarvi]RKN86830.1 amidohydrolase [Paenibacillus ginsengarvi]